ncbi:hypothetical protein N7478_003507 [Penicillium angulare]|uniref:uncharacterized protein n=1 Tax=Penicillium angulare TaxID=116970 RepID=UPI00254130CD|nr:uncharacterized protein N7478_003507 [Penicillium angulare]KAJ5287821.1 hypothetical protein N7478_003507 [Penicillium angulare]
MSRTRRQWLGYFLALIAVLLIYQHSRPSSNGQNTESETPTPIANDDTDTSDSLNPKPPNPDLLTPPSDQLQPGNDQSLEFIWRSLPLRFPATSNLFPPIESTQGIPRIQGSEFSPVTTWFQKSRQAAVKDAFTRCWDSYKSLAWEADELVPMSGLPRNDIGGWGLTIVDNLDTLWIMGMGAEFKEAVATVVKISFENIQAPEINTHEINIRILGGLLGAFDLSSDRRLLKKAIEVGDMLYAAFDTPNRMPIIHWDPHRAIRQEEQIAEEMASASELGAFILEFTRLSQLTGDPKYFDAAQMVMEKFNRLQDVTRLPGMWPLIVNARSENFDGDFFTMGFEDSLYQILPKAYMLLGGHMSVYRKMYEKSTRTIAGHNLFRPMNSQGRDILLPGSIHVQMTQNGKSRTQLESKVHHRACFSGGMFALGGALFNIQTHRKIANKLVDGCTWVSQKMPLEIMPEVVEMVPCSSQTECPWNEPIWKQQVWKKVNTGPEPDPDMDTDRYISQHRLPKGFVDIPDKGYNLRSEVIESIFTLYRVSGREDLLDTAWDIFESIQNATEIINGNAVIADVTVLDEQPVHIDRMDSSWMSQTLKYFYLLFSDPGYIDLDEYVFNSAGHPLKRPKEESTL